MGTLVFDAAPLSAFARAGRLELLDRLCGTDDRVTTPEVIAELRAGLDLYPALQHAIDLSWLRVEPLAELVELRLFAVYAARFGSGERDVGEASVLAWAEAHGAIAITDDAVAVQVARERGVEVRRTLALVARAVREASVSEPEADALVDALLAAGARFPFASGQFLEWARARHLLEPRSS